MIFINCETLPNLSTRPGPEHVSVPGSVSKEETRAKYLADPEKQREGWLRAAVDKRLAQVFVISLLTDEPDAQPLVLANADERVLFRELDTYIGVMQFENHEKIVWNTFNGIGFDFPMLFLRGVKYGLQRIRKEFRISGRYGDPFHRDLYLELGREGTLDEWAQFFGIKSDNPIDGSQMYDTYVAGRWDLIEAHTKSRVTLLRDIHEKMGG